MNRSVNLVLCAGVSLAIGVGVGRMSKGGGGAGGQVAEAGAPAKVSRERKGTERTISATTSADDLLKMIRTGRTDLGLAKVTVTLEGLPPARLEELAAEVREQSRKNPSYDWDQMRLQNAVLSAWADADPKAAVQFIANSPSRNFRSMVMGSVFGAIGQSDPEGAVALAESLGEPADRRSALGAVVTGMAQKDAAGALDLLGRLKGLPEDTKVSVIGELAKTDPVRAAEELAKVSPLERDRFYNSEGMFNTWAASDPEAVLAWAEKATDMGMRNSAMKAACRRLAADDPQAALERLDTLPAHLKKELLATVFNTWADSDLKGALAAAGTLKLPAEREGAMASMIDMMGWLNPENGTEVVLAMPKGNMRNGALDNLAWGMGWQSTTENLKLLEKFSGAERSRLASTLAGAMLSQDADAAIKLFASVPATEREDSSFGQFSWALAAHDPEKALDFAAGLESATERSAMIQQAFQQMARNSPASAAARLSGITDANDRQQALTALAEAWGASDSKAALSWASGLQGAERTSAMASLLPMQAADDPRAASGKLQGLLENPNGAPTSVLQTATSALAEEWAGRDPQATAQWLQGLPSGNAAEAGTGTLISNWAGHDPAAAANWLSTLPAGSMKDAGIEPLIASMRQSDPESAFGWGLNINDATKRETAMEETIRSWGRSDAAAVKRALEGAQLDAAEREKYQKLLE